MSFRLDKEPQIHAPGTLPEVFRVYRDAGDLRRQLITLRESYEPDQDPYRVSEAFRSTYPTFWAGNAAALQGVVERIEGGGLA